MNSDFSKVLTTITLSEAQTAIYNNDNNSLTYEMMKELNKEAQVLANESHKIVEIRTHDGIIVNITHPE